MNKPIDTTKKAPPSNLLESKQFDLFATFFGDERELSNTIELWDGIPKYSLSRKQQDGLRDSNGRLPVFEKDFHYRSKRCRVAIQPASIKQKDGSYLDYYPGVGEELIEEVIKKVFADQRYGIHDVEQLESWARFSLQMLRRELKERGKTRSLDEIKESIEILSSTVIRLYVDDELVYSNPILADVTKVTRKKYMEDGKSMWLARLPALISKSVNDVSYRQLNYGILMSLGTPLSRWLHRRLSHNFINADLIRPYNILLSSIQRDSGFLQQSRMNDRIRTLDKALDELVEQKVLMDYEKEYWRKGKAIQDVKYFLRAAGEFVKDTKAANARAKKALEKLT